MTWGSPYGRASRYCPLRAAAARFQFTMSANPSRIPSSAWTVTSATSCSIGENASDDTKSALRSLQQRVDRLADDARDDRVRHPSFKGMREDKPAKGVKREMPKT